MKKLIFFILFVSLCYGSIAQRITAGLKAGANITNFTGGNFDDAKKKSLVGFNAGGWVNFSLGGLSIQPELLVSTAGARFSNADSSFKLTYLTVPVMVKYRSPGGFYIEAGPQVGFKLNENVGDQTIDNFAKNLDLSVGAGIGYQTKNGFGIGGRYLAGLSKVGDFDASTLDPDFKNSVIQLGISFRLGGK